MHPKYYTGAGHKPLNYVNPELFYLIMNCMGTIQLFPPQKWPVLLSLSVMMARHDDILIHLYKAKNRMHKT